MKDIIGEAAESMREAWELYRAERQKGHSYPLQAGEIQRMAVMFVSKLMPEQDAGTVLAVAKRLRTG